MSAPIIISTYESVPFALKIRDQIKGSEFLSTIRDRFGDPERGEKYFRLNVEDRLAFFGQDVIFVASIVTDDDLAEVCRVGAALAKYGARRVTYVAAFEAYTKMERAVKPGEAVTAKVIARQLSQIPQGDLRNCFLFMDLHTAGFIHYFEGECLRFEIYAEPVLVEAIRELNLENLMFGTADLSRVKWAKTYARIFGTRIAIVDKARDFKTTHVDSVIGDVRGMNVMIYDDMTCTGGSLIDGGDAYIQCGAIGVYAVVSHLALDHVGVVDRLNKSCITKIIATNSHVMSQLVSGSSKFIIKDVSHLFVEVIKKLL